MKTCPNCEKVLPLGAFSPGQRRKSGAWCRDCLSERVRRWHEDNPDFVFPNMIARETSKDAVKVTFRYCNHIAAYTQRSIDRIEAKGLEAPPQMVAIRDMAQEFASAQQAVLERRSECPWCGVVFVKNHGGRKYCSSTCQQEAKDFRRCSDPGKLQQMRDYQRARYARIKQATSAGGVHNAGTTVEGPQPRS